MFSLYFLIPISMVVLGLAISCFLWAVQNDQYEDLDGPSSQIIFDDKLSRKDHE